MNKKLVLISVLLASCIIFTSLQSSAISTIQNGDSTLTIVITDAYYCDADNGGTENDVVVNFDLYISTTFYLYFELYFRLTLPSGMSYIYGYWVFTSLDHLSGNFYFYNHATESGWYTVEIAGVLYGITIAIGVDSHVFDPPGETEGSEPLGNHLQFN